MVSTHLCLVDLELSPLLPVSFLSDSFLYDCSLPSHFRSPLFASSLSTQSLSFVSLSGDSESLISVQQLSLSVFISSDHFHFPISSIFQDSLYLLLYDHCDPSFARKPSELPFSPSSSTLVEFSSRQSNIRILATTDLAWSVPYEPSGVDRDTKHKQRGQARRKAKRKRQ